MKKYTIIISILVFALFQFNAIAQEDDPDGEAGAGFDLENAMDNQSSLSALLGYSDIGGEKFIGFRIQPELAIGKLGFGFDVPIMFNLEDGSFRTDEFRDGVGWARLIRYVRWGVKKKDPVFVKVGDLTGSYIGYGILVDNYSNATSFDKRKVGITFDVLVKKLIGLEGLYSDFDPMSTNLLAIRPYIKPLGMTNIPIAKTLELGYSFVSDHDATAFTTKDEDGTEIEHKNHFIEDGMKGSAIDMGITPISNKFMRLNLYTQYATLSKNSSDLLQTQLNALATAERLAGNTDNPLVSGTEDGANAYDKGTGFSVGANFKFKFLGNVLRLDSKIERLWYNKFFIPQFFNATYEFAKDEKLLMLAQSDGKKGIYGALSVTAIDKIRVGGSLMIPDNVSETAPAILSLHLDASQLIDKVVIRGEYLKGGLTDLSDAFKLDDRSLLTARVAYKLYKFLLVGLDYKWTFQVVEDGNFETSHYATPYVGFSMPLNFGGGGKKDDAIDFGIE